MNALFGRTPDRTKSFMGSFTCSVIWSAGIFCRLLFTVWNLIIIGLIMVFEAILTGKQSGQKFQCLYGYLMANTFFSKLNFTQLVNQNVKILGRTLYSPSLKDLAWQEGAQFFQYSMCCFVMFITAVCILFPRSDNFSNFPYICLYFFFSQPRPDVLLPS